MHVERPKISVLIPVYNVEKYLRRCLDSIVNQDFNGLQIVCVNDASPDGSANILREYAEKYDFIKIITKDRNEGLMMARRTGYENGDGEYFFFCDSDDYLPPNTLKSLYENAVSSEADIIPGNFFYEKPSGNKVLVHRAEKLTSNPEDYLKAILSGTLCTLCGSLYKRSLFEGKNYQTFMNHSFAEDRVLLTQLLFEAKKICPVPTPAYSYFLNGDSMTRNHLSQNQLTQLLKALNWTWNFLQQKPDFVALASKHYSHYLSFLIESGYSADFIKNFSPDNIELLKFGNLKKNLGIRLACHTMMSIKLPIYRQTAAAGRKQIQKLLGR